MKTAQFNALVKDLESLRKVDCDGYTLQIWDLNKQDEMGKHRLAYRFISPQGKVLFCGDDYACAPMHAIDGDETLRSLLCFLTLRPGDTDRDYFDGYTKAQLQFANSSDCEQLQLYTIDDEPLPFRDID